MFKLSYEQEQLIKESKKNTCVLTTRVLNNYIVSTCYRNSSGIYCEGMWYYETFIFNADTLVADATNIGHQKAVEVILHHGKWVNLPGED